MISNSPQLTDPAERRLAQRRSVRKANPLSMANMALLIMVATFAGLMGVIYVGIKIQAVANSHHIKVLEQEIHEARYDKELLSQKLDHLHSREYLERRLANGDFDLEPIATRSLVYLPEQTPADVYVSNTDFRINPQLQMP
jgi:cell division protein FtsL